MLVKEVPRKEAKFSSDELVNNNIIVSLRSALVLSAANQAGVTVLSPIAFLVLINLVTNS